MSNIHTLSSIKSSTSTATKKNAAAGTQIGNTVYRTTNAGSSLLNNTAAQAGGGSQQAKMGHIHHRSSIASKLSHSLLGGKETEYDRQLASTARQKQRVDLPMSPEVRMEAYEKRETIRPEREMMCPQGHKVPAAQAKKQLSSKDVYTCQEMVGSATCDALCGGADVHPLHLEVRHLYVKDKNRYVDSVRWLSRSEVEVQTREYIKGHPLVFPHLAVEVLFHDETDAWLGYILGWNIYYWFADIQKYFATVRKSLEEKTPDEDGDADDDEVERGRGKRRKRKIAAEHLLVEEDEEDEEWEHFDEAAFEAAAQNAANESGSSTSSRPTAAAAAASSSSSAPQQTVLQESNERSEKKAKISPHASPAKPLSTTSPTGATVATAPFTSNATTPAISNPFTVAPQHEVINIE